MKVFAYNARPDEMPFYNHYKEQFGFEMGYCPDELSLENAALACGCEAISMTGSCEMGREVIEKLSKMGVRYAASRTVGYDNIDKQAAKEFGLKVSSAVYSPYSVANFAALLILMSVRKAGYIAKRTTVGDYGIRDLCGREMQNLTVGVFGTGKIGKCLIEHMSGFGCRVIAYDIYQDPALKGAEYVDFETLLSQSDVITIHTILNDSTYHLFNGEVLSKMKQDSILVNVSRGQIIDTKALIENLENGHLGGAALDTFEGENGITHHDQGYRPVVNHDLFILSQLPNVIITPHTAFYTDQVVQDMVKCSLSSIYFFSTGKENPFEIKLPE